MRDASYRPALERTVDLAGAVGGTIYRSLELPLSEITRTVSREASECYSAGIQNIRESYFTKKGLLRAAQIIGWTVLAQFSLM